MGEWQTHWKVLNTIQISMKGATYSHVKKKVHSLNSKILLIKRNRHMIDYVVSLLNEHKLRQNAEAEVILFYMT